MQINALPYFDDSINTTGCCPKFDPSGWDGQHLQFRDKPFVRAMTRSAMHVPLDMGRVIARVQRHIDDAGAHDPQNHVVLSRELSPWKAEHLFSVDRPIPGETMTTLSGEFVTAVFEGPYTSAREWQDDLRGMVREQGFDPGPVWLFYTTCPKCAAAYGKNYVVGFAEVHKVAQPAR